MATANPEAGAQSPDLDELFSLSPIPALILSPTLRVSRASQSLLTAWNIARESCTNQDLYALLRDRGFLPDAHETLRLATCLSDAHQSRSVRKCPDMSREGVAWSARIIPILKQDDVFSFIVEWEQQAADTATPPTGKAFNGAHHAAAAAQAPVVGALGSDHWHMAKHELRTPIHGILALSGSLLETELAAEQRQIASLIQNLGEQLLAIVSDVMGGHQHTPCHFPVALNRPTVPDTYLPCTTQPNFTLPNVTLHGSALPDTTLANLARCGPALPGSGLTSTPQEGGSRPFQPPFFSQPLGGGIGEKRAAAPPLPVDETTQRLKELAPRKRILVAEDNGVCRRVMQKLLGRFGIENVDMATNGQEAVSMVCANPRAYDLIFLDDFMPVMGGPDASVRIRESGVSVPIVGMTALAVARSGESSFGDGLVNEVMRKPIALRLLAETLLRWLRAEEEVYRSPVLVRSRI